MDKQDLEALLVGQKTERRALSYNWRDAALYALAVGAKADETLYTWERGMKAIPTFGVLPYWSALNVSPRIPFPYSAPVLAEELLNPEQSYVNMDYELVMHQPIDPVKGTMLYQDVITDVYDRGEGRGAAIKSCVDVYDETGAPLCSNYCTTVFLSLGGFGGKPMPKKNITIPERTADFTLHDYIGPVQNMLYRLTGDTNLVHCDQALAKSRGFEGCFVHDLCALGYACRMGIQTLFPNEPERMTRIAAQMKSVLYPDTKVQLQLWSMQEGQAYFRFVNQETGKAILDRGVLEWK